MENANPHIQNIRLIVKDLDDIIAKQEQELLENAAEKRSLQEKISQLTILHDAQINELEAKIEELQHEIARLKRKDNRRELQNL
jgi:peptidoglycan hydrolase CwlO-like protein